MDEPVHLLQLLAAGEVAGGLRRQVCQLDFAGRGVGFHLRLDPVQGGIGAFDQPGCAGGRGLPGRFRPENRAHDRPQFLDGEGQPVAVPAEAGDGWSARGERRKALCDRLGNLLFDHPFERPGPKPGVLAQLHQPGHCATRDSQLAFAPPQPIPGEDTGDEFPGNVLELGRGQRAERDNPVEPVEEFGAEELLGRPDEGGIVGLG